MRLVRITNIIYWFFLSLWFGSLVMTGVTAAIAFPTLKERGVIVPGFDAVPESEHFLIAAGSVLNKVFFVNDVIQFIAAIVVTLITGLQLFSTRLRLPKMANLIRLGALAAVLLSLSYHLLVLAPRMNYNLRQYWDLAQQGEDYSAFKEKFDEDHPIARNILAMNTFGLIIIIGSSAYMMIPGRDESNDRRKKRGGSSGASSRELEEPELLSHPPR